MAERAVKRQGHLTRTVLALAPSLGLALAGLVGCGGSSAQPKTPEKGSDQPRARGMVAWPDVSGELGGSRGEKDGQRDAAVIVAIEDYLSLSDIKGAEQNGEDWFKYLTRVRGVPLSNVELLLSPQAKDFAIRKALKDKAQLAQPGGKVWFVFIGHGVPSRNREPLLVAYDADQTPEGIEQRSLTQAEALRALGEGQGTPVAILDTCFSGRAADGTELVETYGPVLVEDPVPPGAVVLTAAASNEFAGPLPGAKRPAFSYLALGGLRGWADEDKDGTVTAEEVRDYSKMVLQSFLGGERSQRPTLSGSPETLALAATGEAGPDITKLVLQYKGGGSVPAPSGALPLPLPRSGQDMVLIPAGTFWMGSDDGEDDEKPLHKQKMAAFFMDRTEVTVDAFAACVRAGDCRPPKATVQWSGISGEEEALYGQACNWRYKESRGRHPMNCVNWNEAKTYCESVGKRLPTEAEWEYAARGQDGRPYPWGQAEPGPSRLNASGNDDGYQFTAPVGSFPAGRSPFGLEDMAGNVLEWTASPYCPYDEAGCAAAARVSRGGGWFDVVPSLVRAAYRYRFVPTHRGHYLGFRCARDP